MNEFNDIYQEEEYMEMIVDKIKDLGPDIVVVSNEVSNAAQMFMCRENITLVKSIESSIMERLARSIRAPVITSIDHINQLVPSRVLGTCQRFYVEYFQEDPLYVVLLKLLSFRFGFFAFALCFWILFFYTCRGSKERRMPLMFFDGCSSNCHATILLRGTSKLSFLFSFFLEIFVYICIFYSCF